MFIYFLSIIVIFIIGLLFILRISIFLLLLSIFKKSQDTNREMFMNNNYYSSLEQERNKILTEIFNKYGNFEKEQQLPQQQLPQQQLPQQQLPQQQLPQQQLPQYINCNECMKKCQDKSKIVEKEPSDYYDERNIVQNLLKV